MAQVMLTTTNTSPIVTFQFAQGEVDSIKETVSSDIDHMPLPLGGPSQAFGFDYAGVTKRITIRGKLRSLSSTRVSGFTVQTIDQAKRWLESLQNGNQSVVQFSSTYSGDSVDTQNTSLTDTSSNRYLGEFTNTMCFVEKFETEEMEGNPDVLTFSMSFIVAANL